MKGHSNSKASRVLPPEVVYRIWKSLNEEWPKTMRIFQQSMGEEMVVRPKKFLKMFGDEFEDFIFARIPSGYRVWLGRSKPLHGKSCVRHEHDLLIYRWDLREIPLILECKVRTRGEIGLSHIMAFNMKVADIYHSHRIEKYGESLNVRFEDLYRVLITNVPLETKAHWFAAGFGILVINPFDHFFPNIAISIYKLEHFLPKKRMAQMEKFRQKLYNLYDLSFRGFKSSTENVFDGEKLSAIVKMHCDAVKSMIGEREL